MIDRVLFYYWCYYYYEIEIFAQLHCSGWNECTKSPMPITSKEAALCSKNTRKLREEIRNLSHGCTESELGKQAQEEASRCSVEELKLILNSEVRRGYKV